MKRMTQVMLTLCFILMCLFTTVYATSNENSESTSKQATIEASKNSSNETLKGESTQKLLEIKKHELTTIENYAEKYGSHTYGVTAYILDRVRIYSIPCVFLGVAFSAIYQYVIGLKRLDVRNKGFNSMIAIITIGIICQILPIIFAIVVTRNGN